MNPLNWLFAFLLGWHPPLQVPPTPPEEWPNVTKSRSFFTIFMPPTHEVLQVKTTFISILEGVVVLVTPEQMSILEAAYPNEQVHCEEIVIFYAPGPPNETP